MRLALHAEFGLSAVYTPPGGEAVPDITVRYHTRLVKQGDLDNQGFAEIVENVTKIVFLQSEVPEPAIGGTVVVLGYTFIIEFVNPPDAPTVTAEVRLDL